MPAVGPVASAQTPAASDHRPRQTKQDRDLWWAFLRDDATVTWIEAIIVRALGYRPDDLRLGPLVNAAWKALEGSGSFRSGQLNGIKGYAYSIVRNTLRRRSSDLPPDHGLLSIEDLDPECLLAAERVRGRDPATQERCAAVREVVAGTEPEARAWAQTFLAAPKGAPAAPGQRRDPIRSVQVELGWTRHACEQARARLAHDLCDLSPCSAEAVA